MRDYIALEDLEVGTVLRTYGGSEATVLGLTFRKGDVEVYDIEVEGLHNFFVRGPGSDAPGVLVHNSTGGNIGANAAQGAAFEAKVAGQLAETQTGVVHQVTVKTQSGVRTRVDMAGRDASTGAVKLTEAKSSATAPLTKNQAAAFPEIAESGGTVVGKGKPGFEGGTQIPPTEVKIVRP